MADTTALQAYTKGTRAWFPDKGSCWSLSASKVAKYTDIEFYRFRRGLDLSAARQRTD